MLEVSWVLVGQEVVNVSVLKLVRMLRSVEHLSLHMVTRHCGRQGQAGGSWPVPGSIHWFIM